MSEQICFLGSKFDMDIGRAGEIRRRLARGKEAMKNLDRLWRDGNIARSTNQPLVKALVVFPVATYRCEIWAKIKCDVSRVFRDVVWGRITRI